MDGGVAQLELAREARIIYANDGFMRMLGAHGAAVPFPLSTIMHPDDLDALVDDIRRATSSHESCRHTCRVKGDGGWMWWRIGAVSIDQDGRNPLVLLTAGDVTSYKDHERRLESINGLLSLALDQAALTLWSVDIPSRRLHIYRKGGDAEGRELSYDDFPSCLVDNGALAPDSVKDFQRFASRLLGGQDSALALLRLSVGSLPACSVGRSRAAAISWSGSQDGTISPGSPSRTGASTMR